MSTHVTNYKVVVYTDQVLSEPQALQAAIADAIGRYANEIGLTVDDEQATITQIQVESANDGAGRLFTAYSAVLAGPTAATTNP